MQITEEMKKAITHAAQRIADDHGYYDRGFMDRVIENIIIEELEKVEEFADWTDPQ